MWCGGLGVGGTGGERGEWRGGVGLGGGREAKVPGGLSRGGGGSTEG